MSLWNIADHASSESSLHLQIDVDVARKILTYVLDDNASARRDSEGEEDEGDAEQAADDNEGSRRTGR